MDILLSACSEVPTGEVNTLAAEREAFRLAVRLNRCLPEDRVRLYEVRALGPVNLLAQAIRPNLGKTIVHLRECEQVASIRQARLHILAAHTGCGAASGPEDLLHHYAVLQTAVRRVNCYYNENARHNRYCRGITVAGMLWHMDPKNEINHIESFSVAELDELIRQEAGADRLHAL